MDRVREADKECIERGMQRRMDREREADKEWIQTGRQIFKEISKNGKLP